METTRWTNPSQPQTLQSSVILLYVNAALGLLFGGAGGLGLLLSAGQVAGGWGCANERRWGYQLAVTVAAIPFVFLFAFNSLSEIGDNFFRIAFALAFDILLLALLLHRESRSYQRIWFR
jgi:hypothetical protein